VLKKEPNTWKIAEKDVILHKGKLNLTESCLDRHAHSTPEKFALIFQLEDGHTKKYTYQQLLEEVNKFSNLLVKLNVKKHSRIFIFLPKCPEMYISFLGAIRHGSIAAPLFEAFQTDGLMLRLNRGDADVLVTNSELAKRIPKSYKKEVPSLRHILVVDSKEYKKKINSQSHRFLPLLMNRKDTAFMIFTSSTAGTPVAGVMIPHQGIIQQHTTAKIVLNLNPDSNYWCTAHPGWVTGAVYGIIAPLSIGCTTFVIEGRFDSKSWIDFMKKSRIDKIYTAPTALRLLRNDLKKSDLANIKTLCSVGEALPTAIFEDFKKLGVEISDTYWQSETGAIVIANQVGMKKKPGSIGKAIPGISAKIKDGMIVLKPGWPSMMTGIYRHDAMYKSYFKNNLFFTNDLAREDKEGYFFFEARQDDIIKTSGERVSPLEIENALLKHKAVEEAAVIGIPDTVKGQVIKAFIVLEKTFQPSDELKEELSQFVKKNYAGHSYPKVIEFVSSLPKTNSGKIIRMKLKQMEEIKEARERIKKGEFYTEEEARKILMSEKGTIPIKKALKDAKRR